MKELFIQGVAFCLQYKKTKTNKITNSISSHNICFVKNPSKTNPSSLAMIKPNVKADNNAHSVNSQLAH